MIYFKGCPKCKGDLYLEEDFYGSFFKCFQCGHLIDLEVHQPGVAKTAAEGAKKLVA